MMELLLYFLTTQNVQWSCCPIGYLSKTELLFLRSVANLCFFNIMMGIVVQDPQPVGCRPLAGHELFATGPQKWQVSAHMCSSPFARAAGKRVHVHSIFMSCGHVCTPFVQMELHACACTCQPLKRNHLFSPSCRPSKPERLGNSVAVGIDFQ